MLFKFEVGKTFPMAYPQSEGATMEMTEDGKILIMIQMPGLDDVELKCIQQGFSRYGLYIFNQIACWTLKFSSPVKTIDCPFCINLYKDERGKKFIEAGGNLFHFCLLDGNILKHQWISGMQIEAINLFCEYIKNNNNSISQSNYNSQLNQLFHLKPEEIMQIGKNWKHFLTDHYGGDGFGAREE